MWSGADWFRVGGNAVAKYINIGGCLFTTTPHRAGVCFVSLNSFKGDCSDASLVSWGFAFATFDCRKWKYLILKGTQDWESGLFVASVGTVGQVWSFNIQASKSCRGQVWNGQNLLIQSFWKNDDDYFKDIQRADLQVWQEEHFAACQPLLWSTNGNENISSI